MNLRGGGNVAYEHVRVVIDVPCPCCTGARSRHYPRECGVDGACTYPRECVRECGVDGACTWHCAGRSARLPLTRMSGTHPSPRLHQARPGALRDPACIRATIEWTRDRLTECARARCARIHCSQYGPSRAVRHGDWLAPQGHGVRKTRRPWSRVRPQRMA